MQHKILFILKNSKTKTTGYYQMNSYVENSTSIKSSYCTKIINLYSNSDNKVYTFLKLIIYSWKIFFYLIKIRPQLVYFTISPVNAFYRDLIYVFIIKLFKVNLIYHLHGKGITENARKNNINLKLYNWAYKDVNVILVSKKLNYDVEFLPIRSIHILPNAIPRIPLIHLPKQKEVQDNSPVRLLFLSNLIKTKGIFDFIESIKILKKEKKNIKVNIVGKAVDLKEDELLRIIGDIADIVTFRGPLYGEEKNAILRNSDVLVFPTLSDIWGIVILEAMQLGLAVIATDEGAITDMIENNMNGFIVEKNNPRDIAKKIKYLNENRDHLKEIGENNIKKYVENYTIERFENNLVTILNQIINND